jgi:hypothetical protein
MSVQSRFVACLWSCGKCHENGRSLVWSHVGESKDDSAYRFSRDTQFRCVQRCAFIAHPEPKPTQREPLSPREAADAHIADWGRAVKEGR